MHSFFLGGGGGNSVVEVGFRSVPQVIVLLCVHSLVDAITSYCSF
jgi:hypothetical protein